MVQICSCRERYEWDAIVILSPSRTVLRHPVYLYHLRAVPSCSDCGPAVPYEMVYQLYSRELEMEHPISKWGGTCNSSPVIADLPPS